MRRAILTKLKKQNYYKYFVLIIVNDKPIGTGAFFHRSLEALRFIRTCKVDFDLIEYKED